MRIADATVAVARLRQFTSWSGRQFAAESGRSQLLRGKYSKSAPLQGRSAAMTSPNGAAVGRDTRKRKPNTPSDDDLQEEEPMQVFKVVKRLDAKKTGATPSSEQRKSRNTASASSSGSRTLSSFFSRGAASASASSSKPQDGRAMSWHASLGPNESCLIAEYGDPIKTAIDARKLRASQHSLSSPQSTSASSSTSSRQKIAAFDLDGTLIETASGKIAYNFVDENDFRIWGRTPKERQVVVSKIQHEVSQGSLVVIVTSQAGLNKKANRLKTWKKRLQLIAQRLDVPLFVVASVERDVYRKPCAGWVEYLRELWHREGGSDVAELDMEIGACAPAHEDEDRSFFVGDAAGRPASKGKGKQTKADFADTDRKLAHNLHWRFFTPEEYFADESRAAFEWSGHRPTTPPPPNQISTETVSGKSSPSAILASLRDRLLQPNQEQTMLVLVGPQASGKSRFATSLVTEAAPSQTKGAGPSWVRVNRDTLKSTERCLSVAKKALEEGKSVVLDNTNPSIAARAPFLDLVAAADERPQVRLIAVHFDIPLHVAQHNDLYRSKRWHFARVSADDDNGGNHKAKPGKTGKKYSHAMMDALPKPIPPVAFHTYYKNLQVPVVSQVTGSGAEPWDEVVRVPGFEFTAADEWEERAWRKWYA